MSLLKFESLIHCHELEFCTCGARDDGPVARYGIFKVFLKCLFYTRITEYGMGYAEATAWLIQFSHQLVRSFLFTDKELIFVLVVAFTSVYPCLNSIIVIMKYNYKDIPIHT